MNTPIQILLLLLLLAYQIKSFTMFCWSLCSIRSCANTTWNSCTQCVPGFMKDPSTNVYLPSGISMASCITQNYDPLSYNIKYATIGKTAQITYDLQSTTAITTLSVATTAVNLTSTCFKDSTYNYVYFGDLSSIDALTITHLGVSDPLIHFHKIRILGGIITIDNTDPSLTLMINFTTNSTQTPFTLPIGPSFMDSNSKVCGNQTVDEYYRIFNHQFVYNDTSSLQFVVSIANHSVNSLWGLMYFVVQVRLCHAYCLSCYGDGPTECYSCDNINYLAKLSGNTCALGCLPGYGINTNIPDTCILCQSNCTSCLDVGTNCTDCLAGYYLIVGNGTINCTDFCPAHYYINTTGVDHCDICDANCQNCTWNATRCISCYPGFYLYNFACYSPCPAQTYPDNTTIKCFDCNNQCYVCSGSSSNCSVCDTNGSFISYLLNTTCLVDCGIKYYEDNNGSIGPNICLPCLTECITCNLSPSFCLSCQPGYYLINNTCNLTCPQPAYFPDNSTWTCLDCNVSCVKMSMNLYFKNNLKQDLICDLNFNQALNWSIIDIQNFIIISIMDPVISINNFTTVYEVVSPTLMRIILVSGEYMFINNVNFTFSTYNINGTYHYSNNGYPFHESVYNVSEEISWFLIKSPAFSETQKDIVSSISQLSDRIVSITTLPAIQQIKKTGILTILLPGAQATSISCLINTIPAQNFYEGVRFWASFVFFDVPPWQQDAKHNKLIVSQPLNQIVYQSRLLEQNNILPPKNIRNLFDTSKMQWRFQRTGHTSFFIFDTYMNIFLIVLCWVMVLVANKCIKHKIKSKRFVALFYSFLHKVHQISIFYITLSTLLQWIYFDAASISRWISFIICIVFNIYFLLYELYIYYDMINYPQAEIGNKKYQYYCLRYGSLLKNIRFVQYDKSEKWNVKHWFRPYNFHILSYYKKFLMMISLPIFYYTQYMQISALFAIQLLQIIRFIVVWPFQSKVRNYIRLGLEIILLLLFGSIIIQTMMMQQVISNDITTTQELMKRFYLVGWIAFSLAFIFNIGYLVIFIYDSLVGCRKSNTQIMDLARKFYYMQRLNTYQVQNQDVLFDLLNKFVKLGNLNNRKFDQLPDINYRIQYFKIIKSYTYYEVQMTKLLQIFMNTQFNYQVQNNISGGEKIRKTFILNKSLSIQFFYLIDSLFKKYSTNMNIKSITIKTFQRVNQCQYKPGQRIYFKKQAMIQKIELQSQAQQKKVIKLDKILDGFPIPYEVISKLL